MILNQKPVLFLNASNLNLLFHWLSGSFTSKIALAIKECKIFKLVTIETSSFNQCFEPFQNIKWKYSHLCFVILLCLVIKLTEIYTHQFLLYVNIFACLFSVQNTASWFSWHVKKLSHSQCSKYHKSIFLTC